MIRFLPELSIGVACETDRPAITLEHRWPGMAQQAQVAVAVFR